MKFLPYLFLLFLLLPACGGDDDEPMEPEELTFAFEGKWVGFWGDSLFPFLNVSAVVEDLGDNRYSGQFFYNTMGNANFTPCCGGPGNDGIFSFTTDGGDVMMDFEYQQNAPDYRGGCPGTYTGAGMVNQTSNRLVVEFTGNDCDGFHDEGKITWERVE